MFPLFPKQLRIKRVNLTISWHGHTHPEGKIIMMSFFKFLFFNKNAQLHFTLPLIAGAVLIAVGWKLGFIYNLYEINYHHLLGYDKVLHTLGGAWWAIFGIALYDFRRNAFDRFFIGVTPDEGMIVRTRHILRTGIFFAIVAGGLWEIAEYLSPWLRNYTDMNHFDTAADLCFDVLGAYIVGRLYQYHHPTPIPLYKVKELAYTKKGE
jgi:hypothetical protein